MASIVKRGKSYSVVYYEGTDKNRQQIWKSGLSFTEAEYLEKTLRSEKGSALKAAIRNCKGKTLKNAIENFIISESEKVSSDGECDLPCTLTLAQFLDEFVEKYGTKKWVDSTYDGNLGLLNNYVYPHRGTEKLASIKTKDIDDFYHFLLHESEPVTTAGKPRRQHISPSIIHDIHKLLRCAFNQAKRWDYIEKNPFDNATLPEYKEKVRQILTPEQVMQVLEHTDRPDDYNYYVIHCAVQLALAGCMRAGEICGAQWDRLDMPEQVLFVDRTIDRVKKENLKKLTKMDILCELPSLFPGTKSVIVLKQPKTEGSIRNVYIPDTVIKKLQALREMQLQMRIDFGDADYTDYGFIIAQANGRPIMRENLNRHFKKILTEIGPETLAKAEDVVFHSIRHTSTGMKLKLSQGDLKTVQAEGGWSSPDMVTKRYAHIIEEDRKKLAQKMEHSFYGNQKSTQSQQSTSSDVQLLAELIMSNPELLTRAIQSVNSANMSA